MNINATIIGQAIAFILFVLFCMKYIWPQLISVIEKRQKEITSSLALAEQAKVDLDIARSEAVNHLKQAKLTAEEIIERANKYKIQIINESKLQAELECKKIFEKTKIKIDTEYKCVNEKIQKQISILALACAEKIIENTINDNIDYNIIDKTINRLYKEMMTNV